MSANALKRCNIAGPNYIYHISVTKNDKLFERLEEDTGVDIIETAKKSISYEKIFNCFLMEDINASDIVPTKINAFQYQKALWEFSKFGTFFYFPEKIINKWFNLVIEKHLLLIRASVMQCSFKFVSNYSINNVLMPYIKKQIGDDTKLINDNYYLKIYTIDEFVEKKKLDTKDYSDIEVFLKSKRTKDVNIASRLSRPEFQDYPFETFSLRNTTNKDFFKENGFSNENWILDEKNKIVIERRPIAFFMYDLGYFCWAATSKCYTEHFGLAQILPILLEVKDNMTIEEKFVWINRAIDVVHWTSDLVVNYIDGGMKSLNTISEGKFLLE